MTSKTIVTCFGLGTLPGAPGTWASLAAIPLAWASHAAGGFALLAIVTIVITATGYLATARYLDGAADDPSEVVIDQVAGMLIALWPLSIGLTHLDAAWHVWPWPGWVLGFLLFRFFDIVKPPPVNWADRLKGPLGVMLDDIVAGVLTALIAVVAAGVAHGWF